MRFTFRLVCPRALSVIQMTNVHILIHRFQPTDYMYTGEGTWTRRVRRLAEKFEAEERQRGCVSIIDVHAINGGGDAVHAALHTN